MLTCLACANILNCLKKWIDMALLTPIRSLLIALLLVQAPLALASVVKEPPASPNPDGRYMFLMFGLQTEILGPDSYNQMYQKRYETTALAKAFSERGYTVITEIRPRNTVEEDYSNKITTQVRQLMKQGVKPENIVVAGHSKGAVMTLVAAGMLSEASLKFVVMAGYALPSTTRIANVNPRQLYTGFIEKYAPKAQGSMLSIYDKEDHEFQTCQEYGQAAAGLKLTEKVVDSGSAPGKGHAAFYTPDSRWLDIVVDWLKH